MLAIFFSVLVLMALATIASNLVMRVRVSKKPPLGRDFLVVAQFR